MGYACKIISFLVSLWSPHPHVEICQSVPCLCASHYFGQFISILNICTHIRDCHAVHTNLTCKSVRKCDVRGEAYGLLHSRNYFWETPGHCCKFAPNPTLIYQLTTDNSGPPIFHVDEGSRYARALRSRPSSLTSPSGALLILSKGSSVVKYWE